MWRRVAAVVCAVASARASAAGWSPPAEVEAEVWISGGLEPWEGTRWDGMGTKALLDLRRLAGAEGGPAAGPGRLWGYFWPRDAAFAAVALSHTGHAEEASEIVDFMARLPFDTTVGFDARYHLDGSRVDVPRRSPQSDGCGWVLWAIGEIRASRPSALPASASELRDRCTRALLGLTGDGERIPPPSADYWEVDVSRTSLGTGAPILAGLRAVSEDYSAVGRTQDADFARRSAERLAGQVESAFAPRYERFGPTGGLDAAIAMLLPPFGPPSDAIEARWAAYQRDARRAGGGLAPGTAWDHDDLSWTPETALVAYSAAALGRRGTAEAWLDWLEAHRAESGSLPEKVTSSGEAAGPAPLLWTASLVLLTLTELEASASR